MSIYPSIHLSIYLSFCDHVYVDTNVHTTIQFNTIYVCVSYTCLVFYGVFTPKPLNRFRRMGDSVGHAAGLKSGSFRKLGKHTQNSTFCGLLYVFHCNANGCWHFSEECVLHIRTGVRDVSHISWKFIVKNVPRGWGTESYILA